MSAQNNKTILEQASDAAAAAYNSVAETVQSGLGADTGRKSMTSKVGDKATPDSSKSVVDKIGETASGAYDKVARDVVPDSQKSTGQGLADKASRVKDDVKN